MRGAVLWTMIGKLLRHLFTPSLKVVVAWDNDGKMRECEVYPATKHGNALAWNAYRHFRRVYGGANVTCASRRLLRLGKAPSEIVGESMTGVVVPRVAPGDPRLDVKRLPKRSDDPADKWGSRGVPAMLAVAVMLALPAVAAEPGGPTKPKSPAPCIPGVPPPSPSSCY